MKKITLASTSPRRKQLLSLLIGENFKIKPSSYEEDNTLKMAPDELVKKHAIEKGKAVAEKVEHGIVISSDTLVTCNGEVFGKPRDKDDAIATLKKISGNYLTVITGLSIIDLDDKKELYDSEEVKVKMKEMTEKEIRDYVDFGEPLDKAGSFGIQGKGAAFVERIEGDYFGVMGFPLCKLNKLLNEVGIYIFDFN